MLGMVSWSELSATEADLARRVHQVFEVRKHKTLATLRRDGSPRISGIETRFADGEVWLGMMLGSVKAADLRRDSRLALHSPTVDPPEDDPGSWPGEAKIAGRALAEPAAEPGDQPSGRFRIDIEEVVFTFVHAGHLVIESWNQRQGLRRRGR